MKTRMFIEDQQSTGLSETLSQICSQQDALMQKLESFEQWVQQRMGKMETILNAMILGSGQFLFSNHNME